MIKVKIFMESNIAHTQQVYTGFSMLRDIGIIDLELVKGDKLPVSSPLIRAQIENKSICFDLSDTHAFQSKELLNSCDIYFKRMLLKEHESSKIQPYGFNYPVLYNNDSFVRRGYATSGWKGLVRSFARKNSLLSTVFDINISSKNSSVQHFEQLPRLDLSEMGVIFYSRLWNPKNVKDSTKQQQREVMNEIRIKAVALLKHELGDRFIGGIQLDEYSKKVAGNALVQDNSVVHKKTYLANLRKSHIGIATEGLEESIGFKFAEYMAMSMAIVSNPIDMYSLPGNFEKGIHYLPYTSAEECVSQCIRLVEDKKMYRDMSVNNMRYYTDYLRPDKLIFNCLINVLSR